MPATPSDTKRHPILLRDTPCWGTGIPGLTGEEWCLVLTKGCLSIVDASEAPTLAAWNWRVQTHKARLYAVRWEGAAVRKLAYLHQQLLQPLPDQEVDHRDQHRYFCYGIVDNRRANLRAVTASRNLANQRKTRGTSKFKGVNWFKRTAKWSAAITNNGQRIFLGYHADEVDAARAYDAAHEIHFPGVSEGRNQAMFPEAFA